MRLWNLKGGVSFLNLGGGLFLTEFEVLEEAERVLQMGIQRFEDKTFNLETWGPNVAYFKPEVYSNHCWVRAVGLPLNFWNYEVFRELGDNCGGLVVVDDDTTKFVQLQ